MEIFGDEVDIVITSEQSIEETTSYIAGVISTVSYQ